VRVSKGGSVSEMQVRRASSSDSVNAAALEAVNAASYTAALKDRKPVEAWLAVGVALRKR
jgi:TonB family protein